MSSRTDESVPQVVTFPDEYGEGRVVVGQWLQGRVNIVVGDDAEVASVTITSACAHSLGEWLLKVAG
jgi:hypothetical protein